MITILTAAAVSHGRTWCNGTHRPWYSTCYKWLVVTYDITCPYSTLYLVSTFTHSKTCGGSNLSTGDKWHIFVFHFIFSCWNIWPRKENSAFGGQFGEDPLTTGFTAQQFTVQSVLLSFVVDADVRSSWNLCFVLVSKLWLCLWRPPFVEATLRPNVALLTHTQCNVSTVPHEIMGDYYLKKKTIF